MGSPRRRTLTWGDSARVPADVAASAARVARAAARHAAEAAERGDEPPKTKWQLLRCLAHGTTAVRAGHNRCGAKTGHGGVITDCAFSPDKRLAVSCSNDASIKLWEVATGKPLRELSGHGAAVVAVVFHRSGDLVLSASWDSTLRLWSSKTGNCAAVYEGHADVVFDCCFSPDGDYAFSASRDTTVKMWEVGMFARCINTFTTNGHSHYVNCCACSADSTMLVTGSRDYSCKVWKVGSTIDLKAGGHCYGNLTGQAAPHKTMELRKSFSSRGGR